MALSELKAKEALRIATDWLAVSALPGSGAAQDGIAATIPLVIMGETTPRDLEDLASIVEQNAQPSDETQRAALREAVQAAFDHVRASSS